MTWVLMLTAVLASGPAGLTSVPGYRSESACVEAGRAYTDRVPKTSFTCIPGPNESEAETEAKAETETRPKPKQQQFTIEWWQNQKF